MCSSTLGAVPTDEELLLSVPGVNSTSVRSTDDEALLVFLFSVMLRVSLLGKAAPE